MNKFAKLWKRPKSHWLIYWFSGGIY